MGVLPVAGRRRSARPPGPIGALAAEFGDLTVFTLQTVRALPGTLRYSSEILRQLAILVRGSTLYVCAMVAALAFVVDSFGFFFLRSAAATDYFGVLAGLLAAKFTIVFSFGWGFSAKVGCGLASEIGTLRINEEIDALESDAINPMQWIVGTRVLAALLFAPILVGVAIAVQMLASYFGAVVVLDALDPTTFWTNAWRTQGPTEQFLALIELTAMAMTMVIVGCFYGYRSTGGPEGVGKMVGRSLTVNLLIVYSMSSLFTAIFYGIDPKLPIGG